MKILAIETSCDETAVAYVEGQGALNEENTPQFKVLGEVTLSQIPLHKEYGGVYPSLAKREHARNILGAFVECLGQAGEDERKKHAHTIRPETRKKLEELFEREQELLEQFLDVLPTLKKPKIDAVAVTAGPGLEPALWVGINFAKALAIYWALPVIPVNHMEGHAVSALVDDAPQRQEALTFRSVEYPAVLLLVSGGHTELILVKKPMQYQLLGSTRDDAAGEAFDKTARLLGLSYPGGPEIATLAKGCEHKSRFSLPRPMLGSDDLDFSFSGLKTAVLYALKDRRKTKKMKQEMAKEIQEAISDILVTKTKRALRQYGAKTVILGGGVTANQQIRNDFVALSKSEGVELCRPSMKLTTDNALMIAFAGFLRAEQNQAVKKTPAAIQKIRADGSKKLTWQ